MTKGTTSTVRKNPQKQISVAKCLFVVLYYLHKLNEQLNASELNPANNQPDKLINSLKLNQTLNEYVTLIIKLTRDTFALDEDQQVAENVKKSSTINELTLDANVTGRDLFRLANNSYSALHNVGLVAIVFDMFKTRYLANLSVINSTDKKSTPANNANPTPTQTPTPLPVVNNLIDMIKNIDDPNTSDEDTTAEADNTSRQQSNPGNNNAAEDQDDFLLIGSWFVEQTSSSAAPVNNTLTPATQPIPAAAQTANDVNSSNLTQILDSTIELDPSNSKNIILTVSSLRLVNFNYRIYP